MNTRYRALQFASFASMMLAFSPQHFSAHAAVTVPAPPPDAPAPPAQLQSDSPSSDEYALDGRIIGELAQRKAALDRREHDLDLREAQIAAAELLARHEVAQMSTLRGEVEKLVVQETSGADGDLVMLAGLYANMKPAQAAAILDKLEVPKAAAILRRLDTRMAGPVLAAMDPAAAAGITQELGRVHAAFQQ